MNVVGICPARFIAKMIRRLPELTIVNQILVLQVERLNLVGGVTLFENEGIDKIVIMPPTS